jgi:hypothetical protein
MISHLEHQKVRVLDVTVQTSAPQPLNFTLRGAKSLANGFKVSPRHKFPIWNLSRDLDRWTVARSRHSPRAHEGPSAEASFRVCRELKRSDSWGWRYVRPGGATRENRISCGR